MLINFSYFDFWKLTSWPFKLKIPERTLSNEEESIELPLLGEDDSVKEEKFRVIQGKLAKKGSPPITDTQGDDVVKIIHLTKRFTLSKKKIITAVDDVCFGIPIDECFGLLGIISVS